MRPAERGSMGHKPGRMIRGRRLRAVGLTGTPPTRSALRANTPGVAKLGLVAEALARRTPVGE
jgi:hypothetical protein